MRVVGGLEEDWMVGKGEGRRNSRNWGGQDGRKSVRGGDSLKCVCGGRGSGSWFA